jgi:glycyl-tRNA synthetase (class II)
MVKDLKTGTGHRADKLVEAFIEAKLEKKKAKPEEVKELESILTKVETFSIDQMHETI